MLKAARLRHPSLSPLFLLRTTAAAAIALLVGIRILFSDRLVTTSRSGHGREFEEGIGQDSSPPLVAVCLVGGLRQFELTAPTIKKYLLTQSRGHLHTFVVTPLDSDAWKVYLLGEDTGTVQGAVQGTAGTDAGQNADADVDPGLVDDATSIETRQSQPSDYTDDYDPRSTSPDTPDTRTRPRVMGVKIAIQEDVPESNITEAGIHPRVSPTGRQGLLKYMALTEACIDLILEAEKRLQRRYSHILRTRPDGLWGGPPPPLTMLDSPGGGLNPRSFHVPPEALGDGGGFAFFVSKCPLPFLHSYLKIVPEAEQEFCNTTGRKWPENWVQNFDQAVGPHVAAARADFAATKNFFRCFARLSRFLRTVPVHQGGGRVLSAEQICRLGFVGPEFDAELARVRQGRAERGEDLKLGAEEKVRSKGQEKRAGVGRNRVGRGKKQEARAKRRFVKAENFKTP